MAFQDRFFGGKFEYRYRGMRLAILNAGTDLWGVAICSA